MTKITDLRDARTGFNDVADALEAIISERTAVTPVTTDEILLGDVSDSDNIKNCTLADIATLFNITNIDSGTYTPTLTNTTNVASSTANVVQYYRVGDMVTVFGSFIMDATSTGATILEMSLPIASDLVGDDLAGSGGVFNNNEQGTFYANSSANRAYFRISVVSTASLSYLFQFSYAVK